MQGLMALSGAQCVVFGQLCRLHNADSSRGGLTYICSQIGSTKWGKYDDFKAGIVPTHYLKKPEWRCCASAAVKNEIAAEDINPSIKRETVIPATKVPVAEGPTVPVKFILQKKCQFGQNFRVVGNVPLFGSWNPKAALPMTWADGHLWSVEVDVPTGKQIEFKFVLTGENGEIEWQPGFNHHLKIEEGISPLIMEGLWDSKDEQKVAESAEELDSLTEDTVSIGTEELSNVAGVGELVNSAKEEIADDLASITDLVGMGNEEVTSGIDPNLGEGNSSPLSSNVHPVELSETEQEVVLVNATPVSGKIQAVSED